MGECLGHGQGINWKWFFACIKNRNFPHLTNLFEVHRRVIEQACAMISELASPKIAWFCNAESCLGFSAIMSEIRIWLLSKMQSIVQQLRKAQIYTSFNGSVGGFNYTNLKPTIFFHQLCLSYENSCLSLDLFTISTFHIEILMDWNSMVESVLYFNWIFTWPDR